MTTRPSLPRLRVDAWVHHDVPTADEMISWTQYMATWPLRDRLELELGPRRSAWMLRRMTASVSRVEQPSVRGRWHTLDWMANAAEAIRSDTLASASLMISGGPHTESPIPSDWFYAQTIGFGAVRGRYLANPGRYRLELQTPGLGGSVDRTLSAEIRTVLRRAVAVLRTRTASARIDDSQEDPHWLAMGGAIRGPRDELPLLDGYPWMLLLPPELVNVLGGLKRVLANAPVHHIEQLPWLDGVGVLCQLTARPDEQTEAVLRPWRAFLMPVLRPPVPPPKLWADRPKPRFLLPEDWLTQPPLPR